MIYSLKNKTDEVLPLFCTIGKSKPWQRHLPRNKTIHNQSLHLKLGKINTGQLMKIFLSQYINIFSKIDQEKQMLFKQRRKNRIGKKYYFYLRLENKWKKAFYSQKNYVLYSLLEYSIVQKSNNFFCDHPETPQSTLFYIDFLLKQKFEFYFFFQKFKSIKFFYYQQHLLISSMSEKNNFLAIASIVNGLVSGSLLVLPIQSLNAGWLTTVVLSLMIGIIECYTSYLIILHGKEHISVYHSVMAHFGGSKTVGGLYNLAVVVSLVWTCVAEFSFLIEQIEGFIPEQTWVGVVVFLGLVLACWAENYLHMSEKIMGMGIFTIFSLCAFIIWAIATTHSGPKKLPIVGDNSFDIATGFMMAYSCHQFMLFVLMRTTQKEDYVKVSVQSFAWGIFAYTLISLGSFAIINRESRSQYAETFQDYFPYGNWQVTLLEGIYFFHILTILPQMTIIIKIRFLQLFNIDEQLQNQSDASSDSQEGQLQTQHHKLRDFLCFFAIIGVCFLVWVLNMKISVIVEINGTVTSMFTIFIFPLLVHFKCVLWDGHYQISTSQEVSADLLKKNNPCSVIYKSTFTKWLQIGTLALILGAALFMAAQTLYATFFSPQQTL